MGRKKVKDGQDVYKRQAYFIDQVIYCLSGLELTPDKYMEEKKTCLLYTSRCV